MKDLKLSHAFALVSKKRKLSPWPTLLRCCSKKTLLAKATHHHERDPRLLSLLLLLRCYGFLERRFRRRKRCGRAWHPRLSRESGTGMCCREGSWSGEPRGSWRRGPWRRSSSTGLPGPTRSRSEPVSYKARTSSSLPSLVLSLNFSLLFSWNFLSFSGMRIEKKRKKTRLKRVSCFVYYRKILYKS